MNNKIKLSVIQNKNITPQSLFEYAWGGYDYISYGEDNKYPQYLWNLYLNSSIHQSIIDNTVNYIYGEGLNIDNKDLNRLTKKIIFDFIVFGGLSIQVQYNALGEKSKYSYVDFMNCRTNSTISKIYYSSDWNKYNKDYKIYDVYKDGVGDILYYRGNKTRSIYPFPMYIGSTQSIETSIEIQNYHLNGIRNNFAPSAAINYYGPIPSDEECEEIETAISEKFTGTQAANRFIINYSESKDSGVEINVLEQNNTDERFSQLKSDTMDDIFIGHRINPILIGLNPENNGFNSVEFESAFQLYNKTVIQPIQEEISELLSDLMEVEISFKPYVIPTFNKE